MTCDIRAYIAGRFVIWKIFLEMRVEERRKRTMMEKKTLLTIYTVIKAILIYQLISPFHKQATFKAFGHLCSFLYEHFPSPIQCIFVLSKNCWYCWFIVYSYGVEGSHSPPRVYASWQCNPINHSPAYLPVTSLWWRFKGAKEMLSGPSCSSAN